MANLTPVDFLAFGCPHAPLHDARAVAWLYDQIADYQPDIIIELGDGFESSASSRWDDAKEMAIHLNYEFEEYGKILKGARLAHPPARCIKIPGNHEDNIDRPGRIDPRIRELLDWRKLIPEVADGHWQVPCRYNYCRTRGVFRLGQVVFAHGYRTTQTGDQEQALLLGDEYGLFVGAHTHRPLPVTQAEKTKTIPLRYWYANVGCLREMNPSYMHRNNKVRWGHGIVVGRATPLKSPRRGRYWEAETRVLQTYDEWSGDVKLNQIASG